MRYFETERYIEHRFLVSGSYLKTPATLQIIKAIPGDPAFLKTTTGDINIPEPITTPII